MGAATAPGLRTRRHKHARLFMALHGLRCLGRGCELAGGRRGAVPALATWGRDGACGVRRCQAAISRAARETIKALFAQIAGEHTRWLRSSRG
jgi:hypothetical protein